MRNCKFLFLFVLALLFGAGIGYTLDKKGELMAVCRLKGPCADALYELELDYSTKATPEILAGTTDLTIRDDSDSSDLLSIKDDGDLELGTTGDIGWAVVAGANTACNTTCTYGCVFGVNTASATADIVNCADATADECLCAGPS